MTRVIDHNRRRFFGTAAITVAAVQFGMISIAQAQAANSDRATAPVRKKPGALAGFAAIKQINAGVLNVGYAEAGPADGPVVILLHGWPYDIHTYVDVTPLLAAKGYRVIVPHLRGYSLLNTLFAGKFSGDRCDQHCGASQAVRAFG
jgi:hypothetical protein